MNNKVIYTCLTASYDRLLQPAIVDSTFDYICFSNEIESNRVGVWNIRRIPFDEKDPVRLSRMVKLLPHNVLDNYEYSIWIDANLQIKQDKFYLIINSLIENNSLLAQIAHPYRDCIYDEIYICLKEGRVSSYDSLKQFIHLRKNKYPIHNGLYENNIILRRHNDPLIKNIDNDWAHEYLNYSKRDQFSLCYILWRYNFNPDLLLPVGSNSRNVSFIEYHQHKNRISNKHKWEYRISKYLGSRIYSILKYIIL